MQKQRCKNWDKILPGIESKNCDTLHLSLIGCKNYEVVPQTEKIKICLICLQNFPEIIINNNASLWN